MRNWFVNAWLALLASASGVAMAAPLIAFTSSASGNGNLSTWPGAGANTGLVAGDAVCQSLATTANLPNPSLFIAWLSDSNDDAYCRVHGLTGKKADNCGLPALPAGAGPWVRADGFPFLASIDQALSNNVVYSSLNRNELGVLFTPAVSMLTGTGSDGALGANGVSCANWTATDNTSPNVGSSNLSANGWTSSGSGACNFTQQHLVCMQKGSGSALPNFSERGRREAFVASLDVTGNIGATPLAGANTGVAAGDAICRSLATQANVYAAQSFKAFLSDTSTSAIAHFQFDGPWVRRDGLRIADGLAQLATGVLNIPLNQNEGGTYLGNYGAWTGATGTGGIGPNRCNDWTSTATMGSYSFVYSTGVNWGGALATTCSASIRIYCLADIDIIFHNDFEP